MAEREYVVDIEAIQNMEVVVVAGDRVEARTKAARGEIEDGSANPVGRVWWGRVYGVRPRKPARVTDQNNPPEAER